MGGATALLMLLALVMLRQRGSQQARDRARGDGQAERGPSSTDAVAQRRAGPSNLPRFTPQPERSGERHSQALLMKQKARASGGRVPGSAELFDGETRDLVWAPAMERSLSERFRQNQDVLVAGGLKSATIQAPECRTSTCRFEIHYTDQELALAREAGVFTAKLAPSGYLFQNTGPFARSWSDYQTEPIEVVDGVTRMRQIIHVVFGEQDSDPGSYAAWVAEARKEMAHQKSLGPKAPAKGLPPWVLNLR
jgi:hypothetical protein